MRHFLLIFTALVITSPAARPAFAQGTADLRLFEQHCTTCHGNPKGPAGAADGLQLRKMTPEAVYAAIAKGDTQRKFAGRTARRGQARLIAEDASRWPQG